MLAELADKAASAFMQLNDDQLRRRIATLESELARDDGDCPRKADLNQAEINVSFGSKADICSVKGHVRFTPESGHVRCNWGCPLCAKSRHSRNDQREKAKTASFPIHRDQAAAREKVGRLVR